MNDPHPTILVTGIAGNLGQRVLPLLSDFRVVGVDVSPIAGPTDLVVLPLDLGRESSCVALVRLLRETNAHAVVHLAFVSEPLRNGVTDRERMWQINVAGTGRVMEAIAEVNRRGGNIQKFIYLSSAAVYGPETEPLVDEEAPLGAHTMTYAMQKAEADGVVRFRAGSMGQCSTYLLRPQIVTGASVESCPVNMIRGRAFGVGKLAATLQRRSIRLPLLLPSGERFLQQLFQFVHVDDMARLVTWLLQKAPPQPGSLLTLNVAGTGEPITLARCAEIAKIRTVHLPSRWICAKALTLLWKLGISAVPPDAFPYIAGTFTMNTDRLRKLLGADYAQVIQYSNEAALRDCLPALMDG